MARYDKETFLSGFTLQTSGSAAVAGSAELSGGTVTVLSSAVRANSKVFVTRNTPAGTVGHLSVPSGSIVASSSFVINSDSPSETSSVNWWFSV